MTPADKIGPVLPRGLDLSTGQLEQLERFAGLVAEGNLRMNLVSRREAENLWENHILDSLAALPLLMAHDQPMVLDLGPGGGFPGIPLKICLPVLRLTCLEATQKKARFIELAVRELGLADVTVIAKHSQEAQKDRSLLKGYDFITARAVAELKDLAAMALPFLRPGGQLLAYKSSRAAEEVSRAAAALKKMGASVEGELMAPAPASDKNRRIIIIKKHG